MNLKKKMIEVDNHETDDLVSREHRRKGGAFDTLSRVLTNVTNLVFKNSIQMTDRGGVNNASEIESGSNFVRSQSVFETYHRKAPKEQRANLIHVGRSGKGGFRNTNYHEITVDGNSDLEKSSGNGKMLFSMSRDGVVSRTSIVGVNLERTSDDGLAGVGTGSRWFITGGDGTLGGLQLSRVDSGGNVTHYIVIDEDGLQFSHTPVIVSDIRQKKNISPLSYGLKEVEEINPIKFERINEGGKTYLGFSAQDMEKILPEIVNKTRSDKEDILTLATQDIIPVLVNAIKELSNKVKKLEENRQLEQT